MNKKMILFLLIAFSTLVLIVGGCKSNSTDPYGSQSNSQNNSPPTPNTIAIASFAFSPLSFTISRTTTVTFKNNDSAIHSATSDNGSWDTGDIPVGGSKTITFNTAGTYSYHCTRHPSMRATMIVQ